MAVAPERNPGGIVDLNSRRLGVGTSSVAEALPDGGDALVQRRSLVAVAAGQDVSAAPVQDGGDRGLDLPVLVEGLPAAGGGSHLGGFGLESDGAAREE